MTWLLLWLVRAINRGRDRHLARRLVDLARQYDTRPFAVVYEDDDRELPRG